MEAILNVVDLVVRFGAIRAVEKVSFTVGRGETLGIVGESGCGKSTLIRAVLRLGAAAEATKGGSVLFGGIRGHELVGADPETLRALRCKMQIVQQDPYSSLNPSMTVLAIIAEPLMNFGATAKSARDRVRELMVLVGLGPKQESRFPHELSGGQRQRVAIARALALKPEFLVCDEPTSALDLSIRAQIINLLEDLKRQFGLTLIFVSHDLSTVRHISDRVAVMYLGKIVEIGPADEIIHRPAHPYSKALVSAIPVPDPDARRDAIVLTGEIPNPKNPPSGCVFRTRCSFATAACTEQVPALREYEERRVACHRLEEIARPPASP